MSDWFYKCAFQSCHICSEIEADTPSPPPIVPAKVLENEFDFLPILESLGNDSVQRQWQFRVPSHKQ